MGFELLDFLNRNKKYLGIFLSVYCPMSVLLTEKYCTQVVIDNSAFKLKGSIFAINPVV